MMLPVQFDVYEGVHVLQKLMTSAPPKVMTLGAANSELTQASALLSELSGIVQVNDARSLNPQPVLRKNPQS